MPEAVDRNGRHFCLLAMPGKQVIYRGVIHAPTNKDWDIPGKSLDQLRKLDDLFFVGRNPVPSL